eukprot:NODE_2792_length_1492_cov_83.371074_g2412_i0.p1 GENE.NODE_2792_length_1492_cov_83.371074_g2412_i0~~NODE_2792_length_1492_cov_83.371074_g2412_i0.p1  ORF type:complete len:456 (-),score=82.54 NODE_2792_length_1492_cov_83.371074_g2412_i0:124-1434(-)
MKIVFVVLSTLLLSVQSHFTAAGTEYNIETIVYGKYWTKDTKTGNITRECNTYYLFVPLNASRPMPLILEIHGGAFVGGDPTKKPTPQIEAYLNNGIAWASTDYRFVTTKYYYGDEANPIEEEYIEIDSNGTMTLIEGTPLSNYHVRVGRQEYITKSVYDISQALLNLASSSAKYGLDIHRLGLTGGSAGGAGINYLTYVFHSLDPTVYTPVSIVYQMAQLDYPVENVLDRVWHLWGSDIGFETKLSLILSKSACGDVVGNPFCKEASQTEVCNSTWNDITTAKYCGNAFEEVTIDQLLRTQIWPVYRPEYAHLIKLWYATENMLFYHPPSLKLYVVNFLNGTSHLDFVHNALYARNYALYAGSANIDYVVYYTDYHGMTSKDISSERYEVPGLFGHSVFNKLSNFGWAPPKGTKATSDAEQLLFHCQAMSLTCSI